MVWLRHSVISSSLVCVAFVLSNLAFAETDSEIPEMHIMPDGTLSWEQPDSTGLMGYNGYCGETAAANIVSMLRYPTSPDVVKKTCRDSTPGTLPATIADYLSGELNVQWNIYNLIPNIAFDELKSALENGALVAENGHSPVAVLVKVKNQKAYHWITIVNIDAKDRVIFNEYGEQKSMSKKDFLDLWSFKGITPIWRRTLNSYGVIPYTMVSQVHIAANQQILVSND